MKISLNQQIEEIEAVSSNMKGYLGNKVSKKQMRPQDLQYRMDRLSAVDRTLRWLAENEKDIRDYLQAKKEGATG